MMNSKKKSRAVSNRSFLLVRYVCKEQVRSYRKASCGHSAKGAVYLQSKVGINRKVGSFCKGGVQSQRVGYKRKGLGGVKTQME